MRKLTYDYCKNEVLKYKSRQDIIKKDYALYRKIRNKKWFELLETVITEKDAWCLKTKEDCKKIVLKYKTLKDFREHENCCYRKIIRHGWKDLLDNLEIGFGKFKRDIYAYEFPDFNTVYVGLSFNVNIRDKDHHRSGTVYNFTQKMGIKNFSPIILEKNVEYDKAGNKEEYYIEKYKKNGWNLLNKAPAGSLGGDILKKEVIVCFNKNGNFIKKENIEYFVENNYAKLCLIRICLRKKHESTGDYRFFYEDEWKKMGCPLKIEEYKLINERKKICILDDSFNLINILENKKETLNFLGYKSTNNPVTEIKENIIVKGKKTCWVCYYDDYLKYKSNKCTIVKPTVPKNKKLVFVDNIIENKIDFANKLILNKPQYKINQLVRQKKRKMKNNS